MQENYIHIFSWFIGDLLEKKRIEVKDAYLLMKEFEPACDNIKTRSELITFIDRYINKYWELKELRKQLQDSNFQFPEI